MKFSARRGGAARWNHRRHGRAYRAVPNPDRALPAAFARHDGRERAARRTVPGYPEQRRYAPVHYRLIIVIIVVVLVLLVLPFVLGSLIVTLGLGLTGLGV